MFSIARKAILAGVVIASFTFWSCEETVGPITPTPTAPSAPTNLMATSVNDSTIRLKWTASVSESDTDLMEYYVSSGPIGSALPKGTTVVNIANLPPGSYPFTIVARRKTTPTLVSPGVSITWSTAKRYTAKLYESASASFGSGLSFKGDVPKTLLTTSMADWDLGLDTKPDGAGVVSYDFGSATKTSYATSSSARTTLINSTVYDADSLENVYHSGNLTADAAGLYNFNAKATTSSMGVVMIVKTQDGKFAKILMSGGATGMMKGTAPDRYIDLVISYQASASPHALTVGGDDWKFEAEKNYGKTVTLK